jgi:predicted Rossmann fold nucleotide-binding protein DprA/Smf involved in DNA uptake
VCRHDSAYPQRLARTADAPAVLHVAGDQGQLAALGGDDAPRSRSSARAAQDRTGSRSPAGSAAGLPPPA